MKTLAPPAVPVKSALRVIEILEYFSQTQTGATVTDLSTALNYPQSSTSMLLGSLTSMGYLKLDELTRQYRPTLRVMLLGLWLHDALFAESSLMSSMKMLAIRAKAGVLVGLRQGIHVRFILSLPSGNAGVPRFPPGVVRPICRSAAGKVLLASESDDEVVRIATTANATVPPLHRVNVPDLVREVRQIRRQGWAESIDYPKPGWANLAMQLPAIEAQPPMAVTLGVRMEALQTRRQALVDALTSALLPLRR